SPHASYASSGVCARRHASSYSWSLLLRLAEVRLLELLLDALLLLGQLFLLVAVKVLALVAVLLFLDPMAHHRVFDVAANRLAALSGWEADLPEHSRVLKGLADDDTHLAVA